MVAASDALELRSAICEASEFSSLVNSGGARDMHTLWVQLFCHFHANIGGKLPN